MKYLAYLLYNYYSKGGTKNIAYFSSLSALTFLTTMHIFLLFILFNKAQSVLAILPDSKSLRYLVIFTIMMPVYLVFHFSIKEKTLKAMKEAFGYEHFDKEFNHRALFFGYIICFFVGLAITIRIYV